MKVLVACAAPLLRYKHADNNVQNFGELTAPQVFAPMVAGFNHTSVRVAVRYISARNAACCESRSLRLACSAR